MRQINLTEPHIERIFGIRDENLRYLEERLRVQVAARGGLVAINGQPEGELIAARLLEAFDRMLLAGAAVGKDEFRTGVRVLEEDADIDLVEFFLDAQHSGRRSSGCVVPRNLNQRLFLQAVPEVRLRVRHRTRRHRQDLPRGGHGRAPP